MDGIVLEKVNVDLIVMIAAIFSGITLAIVKILDFKTKSEKLSFIRSSFENTVEKLSSEKETDQLSAAILLRRFFDKSTEVGGRGTPYKQDAIDIIASILRITSTGAFQKTLGDSLAYAANLKSCDFQKINLQNVYLGSNSNRTVDVSGADFFQADLSQASLKGVVAKNTIFFQAKLHNTVLRNSDLRGANFQESDLLGAIFDDASLEGSCFKHAGNIPKNIAQNLDAKWIYRVKKNAEDKPFLASTEKNVFVSCSNVLSIYQKEVVEYYISDLKRKCFSISQHTRDCYSPFGQLSEIRRRILSCSGVICFAFKNTNIEAGTFRPKTPEESKISDSWIATPWNHIELGMAAMVGVPVLIIKDAEIQDGAFDPAINEIFLYTVSEEEKYGFLEKSSQYRNWLRSMEQR